jgi:sugar phosphate isomerase/epimerase
MRLAISNIAWRTEFETEIADRLAVLGVDGVEIAPTKVWPHPLAASEDEVVRYRDFWESRGLPIVALQSLLFEKPVLRIFADAGQRKEAAEYLRGMIELGGRLGAQALVFGSPKNRAISPRSSAEVMSEAISFFRELGDAAAAAQTCLCVEPNPPAYGCDFITSAGQGIELVRAVDHPGVKLHLDTACMALAGDDAAIILQATPLLWHFHVSEPHLGPVGGGVVDPGPLLSALQAIDYKNWVSIEMKTPAGPFSFAVIERACRSVLATIRPPTPSKADRIAHPATAK